MPTYCTLSDAYGPSWGAEPNQNKSKSVEIANKKREDQYNKRVEQAQTAPRGETINMQQGVDSNCPNCNHCLRQNNQFQQKVVEQAIHPLPRWVPQYNNVQSFDPFNRYFAPNKENFGNYDPYNPRRVENFGNLSSENANNLIQMVLYLLIMLFVIQLLELVGSI